MKIALDVLRRYTDLPDDPREVRRLMDECGLEVKRVERDAVDTVFTLELLANRGDHHCYEGVARELTGRTGAPLRVPPVAKLETGPSPWDLRCETPLCLVYTATLLAGPGAGLSPATLRPLEAAGIHSLSAPVDATNLANVELGQPTHAFDADAIEGPITIRTSRKGERAWPLFHPEPIALPEGTLVIADDRKILAIAGVIGCEESKTTERTTRLLLESACFDPVSVRKASRALRIATDSSARFERGSDPDRPLVGAGRVVELLEREAGWRRLGPTGVVGDWRSPDPDRRVGHPSAGRVVSIGREQAAAYLGVAFGPGEIEDRLGRYGFSCRAEGDRIHASVPSWRLWDVEFPEDLYEELAKSVGYDETATRLPPVELGALPSPAEARKRRVDEVLVGNGFYEVFTDGFYGRNVHALLGIPDGHPLQRHVETTNAVDRAYSLLKNNALHQAVEAVAVNERRRTLDVKMYEWTRTFHPVDELLPERPDPRRPPCVERRILWAIVAGRDRPKQWRDPGRPADVFFLKGLVDELGVDLGLALEVGAADPAHPLAAFLHPGRQATVLLDGEPVGVLGEVHPAVCRRYKLKHSRPCYLEITQAALFSDGQRPAYEEPGDTQPITRAVAFDLPHRVEAGSVAAFLHASGPDWLEKVAIVDLFEHDGLRAVTFEVAFTNPEGGRSADEVNAATQSLVAAVLGHFGPRGVRQR